MDKINLALCSTGELYGGVEQFIYTFSNYLKSETKLNFIVIIFNKGLLYEKLKEAKIETYIISSSLKYNIGVIRQIIKLFKEKKINVIHTHGYKANVLCSIAGKVCNAKIIKTEHGKIEPSTGYNRFKMQINHKIDRIISRLLLDEIVFVSKDIESYYKRYYKAIKSTVIYNGIPRIEVNSNKNLQDFDYNAFNIGIVGRLTEVKGHLFLLRALKNLIGLGNIKLNIFGNGHLEERLRDYCNKNDISSIVIFHGFKENIYEYIAALDVLVMPSLHEGMPYVLLEAMYLRVPIIASDVGGLKEVIDNNHDGILVPSEDEVAIANAIEQIYNNQKLRITFTQKAYKKICSKFSISYMGKRYIDLYLELICKGLKSPKNWGKI